MLSDLKVGTVIHEIVLCRCVEERTTKTNKPYFTLKVSDRTGTITANDWEHKYINGDEAGSVIEIDGNVVEFNGELQITISKCVLTDLPCEPFCPASKYSQESMFNNLVVILNEVEDTWCKRLIAYFIENNQFRETFCKHSAARSIHHDYVHGLLEHTLYVTKLSATIGSIYKNLNKDLLITAAFLHDVGKTYELSSFPTNDYTTYGNLIGHVAGSALMVNKACDTIEGFPEDTRLKIIHCILAHHGKLEWGSPKLPALPEAFVISTMDNLDAKLKIFEKYCDSDKWSPMVRELGTAVHSGEFLDG